MPAPAAARAPECFDEAESRSLTQRWPLSTNVTLFRQKLSKSISYQYTYTYDKRHTARISQRLVYATGTTTVAQCVVSLILSKVVLNDSINYIENFKGRIILIIASHALDLNY